MPISRLQDEFLHVLADGHRATARRLASRISDLIDDPSARSEIATAIESEIRGLYHGTLVVLDNGSSLADHGMIKIVDDDGAVLGPGLHEIGFESYERRAEQADAANP